MKLSIHGILAWRRLGLLVRLILLVGPVILAAGLLVFYAQSQYAIKDAHQIQDEQLQHLSSSLLPLLARSTVSGDYSDIHLILSSQVAHSKTVKEIAWTFANGITLISRDARAQAAAPTWFLSMFPIPDASISREISLTQNEVAVLNISLTATPSVDRLWEQFLYMARVIAATCLLVLCCVLLILHSNLRALRKLTATVNAFRTGDFSARIEPQGAQEFQVATQAYNDMAQQVEGLVGDLSANKLALSNQLKFISKLLDAIPNPVSYMDVDGLIVGVNKAWENFFHMSRDDVVGKSPTQVFSWDAEFAREQNIKIHEIIHTPSAPAYETTVRDKNGVAHNILMSRATFHDADNRLSGIIEIITDLSDLKTAQKEIERTTLEKLRAETASVTKSRFLAHISHEMRTPLTAIIGFSEMLLDVDLSAERRVDSTNTVLSTSRHLLQLINDLLDIAKIEAGKLTTETIRTDLLSLMHEIESVATMQAGSKGLYFKLQQQTPLPETIATDPLRLKQIMLNLCSNAIKFTAQGGVTLHVRSDAQKQQIVFSIADTGIGVSKEQAANLFTQFSQADASTSRKYGGTGLGLYLSKSLAEKLGGDLSMTSELGKGSCFIVRVASGDQTLAAISEHGQQTPPKSKLDLAALSDITGSILLAEDVVANQILVAYFVGKTGAKLDIANNGEEVLQKTAAMQYDLVLMDMQMPVMDGLQATRELRKRGYSGEIVALTANAGQEDKEQFERAGCDGFLSKPFDRNEFYQTLADRLRRETERPAIRRAING